MPAGSAFVSSIRSKFARSGRADPHWDDSARNFIEAVSLHVATWPDYEGRRTLGTVRDLITTGARYAVDDGEVDGMDGLDLQMTANAAGLDAHADADADPRERALKAELAGLIAAGRADFFDKPENECGSVFSTACRHTKFLDYPQLREALAPDPQQGQFALTELKTAPQGLTVYLCLRAGRMSTCNRWFRFFVNMALEAMERENSKPKIPVLAVLEEFHVLGHIQQVETAAALVAGLGMELLIVLQDLTQLRRHYRKGWETFLGNAGAAIFLGNADTTTLKYCSERCGQTSLIVERGTEVSYKQRETGATGASWSLEVRDLLTPEGVYRFLAGTIASSARSCCGPACRRASSSRSSTTGTSTSAACSMRPSRRAPRPVRPGSMRLPSGTKAAADAAVRKMPGTSDGR